MAERTRQSDASLEQFSHTPDKLLTIEAGRPLLRAAFAPAYITVLTEKVFAQSPWTGWHEARVALIDDGIITEFPDLFSEPKMKIHLLRAAKVHDNGKGDNDRIPNTLLDFAGFYNQEQRLDMQTHVPVGKARIATIDPITAEMMGAHHEFQGARSYPLQIEPQSHTVSGFRRDVYLGKLLIAVADVTDASMSLRPERGADVPAVTKKRLHEQFDPYFTAANLPVEILDAAAELRANDPNLLLAA
jgi:HD-GYP domain-containing protein (c-di-GMP phosphodiesterase class II)